MTRYNIKTQNKGVTKIVGAYDDQIKAFSKTVDSKKHTCWKHNAYGISTSIVNTLKTKGCERVLIQEKDTLDEYASPFSLWIEEGIIETLHPSAGEQYFLPKSLMTVLKNQNHEYREEKKS